MLHAGLVQEWESSQQAKWYSDTYFLQIISLISPYTIIERLVAHFEYHLDNYSILEINLKTYRNFSFVTVLTGEKWILEKQKASINAFDVSHSGNISFSYFTNVF